MIKEPNKLAKIVANQSNYQSNNSSIKGVLLVVVAVDFSLFFAKITFDVTEKPDA